MAALSFLPNLTKLFLTETRLDDSDCQMIAASVNPNSLRTLNLLFNYNISFSGVMHFHSFSQLEELAVTFARGPSDIHKFVKLLVDEPGKFSRLKKLCLEPEIIVHDMLFFQPRAGLWVDFPDDKSDSTLTTF